MYSREEKLKAVELFIKYDKSPASVIRELGYPCRATLYAWYEEYLANGCGMPSTSAHRRYTEEQKRTAVDHFFEHGRCLARTMRALGYPSQELLAAWIDELEPGRRPKRSSARRVSHETKEQAVIDLVARRGAAKVIADGLGIERATLYNWKRKLLSEEVPCKLPRKKDDRSIEELEEYAESLRRDIDRPELQRAILEGTVELLGKDRSVDPGMLTNREKTILVESLRSAHRLGALLDAVGMAKSSYLYQKNALLRPDKHADLRIRITEVFHGSDRRYGYRRVHAALKSEEVVVSEKVVCRIMKEEGLIAKRPSKRKYSSYKGEIGEAPKNIVKRDFHADGPNRLWLTDITEFSIPAGKVYLSPIIDCFDGMCVAWTQSTSPNAELVNSMLDAAASKLPEGEHPVSHSDRGCHYRWPGWIERCERYGITRSMSKKGCSPDNSAMEGFFGRLKVEFFYGRDWSGWSIHGFMDALDEYTHWYNEERIKLSLGGMSPMQYRRSLGLAA